MHGNVMELCEDYYDTDFYAHSPVDDPLNAHPHEAWFSVIRGGSWYRPPVPAAFRSARNYDVYSGDLGFRVAVSIAGWTDSRPAAVATPSDAPSLPP